MNINNLENLFNKMDQINNSLFNLVYSDRKRIICLFLRGNKAIIKINPIIIEMISIIERIVPILELNL